ncbi:MAG: hypothetical protein QF464_12325, partial [Myxococcota bacterium]|nr:hypothetical protein [Myxococcota bacterium]
MEYQKPPSVGSSLPSMLCVVAMMAACSSATTAPELQQGVDGTGGMGADATRGLVPFDAGGRSQDTTIGSQNDGTPGPRVDGQATQDAGPVDDTQASGDGAGAGDAASVDDTSTTDVIVAAQDVAFVDDADGASTDATSADAVAEDAVAVEDSVTEDAVPEPACLTDDDCVFPGEVSSCLVPACVDGACVLAWVADGAWCDDGDPCTVDDHCSLGQCVASVPFDCNDGDPCTEDDCWEGVGCVQIPIVCEDGDPCTLDACDPATGCNTKPVNCPPSSSPCEVNQCDGASGACVTTAIDDDTPCDDGDSCTGGDACEGGSCLGESICACQSDADCADATTNPCLGVNVCDPATHTCVPDSSTAVLCPNPLDSCHSNACDPSTGACVETPLNDGTVCGVPGPCDASATCLAGACVPTPKVCTDGDLCTVDSCDAVTGECVHEVDAGVACDDGDPCTQGETCTAQGCAGGESVCECQSDADCQADVDVCAGTLSCSDANTCVLDESTALQCAGQVSECQQEVCSTEQGACVLVDLPEATACDAGPCFQEGACLFGDCVAFPIDCDDDDPCTEDGCDLAS